MKHIGLQKNVSKLPPKFYTVVLVYDIRANPSYKCSKIHSHKCHIYNRTCTSDIPIMISTSVHSNQKHFALLTLQLANRIFFKLLSLFR